MPPIASLIAAAGRVAFLAATKARNAATMGVALSRRVAAAGRMLISSADRAARATYRAFTQRARNMANRARALGAQLWRALANALKELRLAALRIMRAVRRIFVSPSEPPEPTEEDIRQIAKRYPGARSAIEALRDAIQDERLMRRLIELTPEEDQDIDELAVQAMSEAYQAEIRSLLEEFSDEEDEDVALEKFYERAAPYILAARLAAGDDPTVLDDIDVEEHLAQLGEDFVETLREESPSRVLSQASRSLLNAVSDAYKRARHRLAMAHNLAVSVNVEQFAPFAAVQEAAQRSAQEAVELTQAYEVAQRKQFGIADLLKQLATDIMCGLFEKEEEEDEEEPGQVVYGVWRVNCTRAVTRHCQDCLALEAVTATEPVPIEDLPTPGAETACGDNCACCVDEVSREEALRFAITYWSGAPHFVPAEQVESMFFSGAQADREAVLARLPAAMANKVKAWLNVIEEGPDVPHAA